jgi:hypothetical protein
MKVYGVVDVDAHVSLPPGIEPPVPMERRLDGPQSWSGQYREVKIFHSAGTRTLASHDADCTTTVLNISKC